MSKSPSEGECEVRSSAERKGPVWKAVGRRLWETGKNIKDISESGKLTMETSMDLQFVATV